MGVLHNRLTSMKERYKSTTVLDLQILNDIGQVSSDTDQLPRTHACKILN